MTQTLSIALLTTRPHNGSNKSLIAAARKRGHHIQPFNTLSGVINCDKNSFISQFSKPFDAILPRIGGPLAGFGSAYIRAFETAGVYCVNSAAGILTAHDKFLSGQILSAAGMDIPKTVTLARADFIDDAIKAVGGLPIIVKLLSGTQGNSVIKLDTIAAAQSRLQEIIYARTPFLVQEFIAESSGTDIRAFVVDGHIAGAMERTGPKGEFRSNLHQGGTARPVSLSAKESDMAIKAAHILGLGMAGVDILRTSGGPKLLEVNASPGLVGIESATQIDIAGQIIDAIESRLLPNLKAAQ
ncbi:MAG: RimK family alpha-L-glutamate ligase [Robiginitomaculum sp.]